MVIYKIENKINGRIYIGQTRMSVSRRIAKHIEKNKYPIQKALNKYGLESFLVSIIDESPHQETLDEKEAYWIKFYDCKAPNGYNLTNGGMGVNGYKCTEENKQKFRELYTGRHHSEEAKKKISLAQIGKSRGIGRKLSEEHKQKIRDRISGTHRSDETKKRMSKAQKGRVVSIETRKKMSEIFKGRHISEEHKQKLKEANTGIYRSEETREKLRAAWVLRKQRGYKHTPEAREKNRQAHLGKKMSDETKRKISIAHTGRKLSEEHKRKLSMAKKGKLFSEEHKRKLSILKTGENHPMFGKHLSEATKQKIGKANAAKHPSEEVKQRISETLKRYFATKKAEAA
jgi:group I intron endonuclease